MELKSRYNIRERRSKRNFSITKDILLRHKLLYLKETMKNIPSNIKYFLFLILLILINALLIRFVVFILILTTTEIVPILIALIAFNSVIITAIGILYQVEANNKREIEFKVHRQRRVRYENLIEQIKSDISPLIIVMAIKNTNRLNPSESIGDADKIKIQKYIDSMFDLMLYGSPELIEIRIKQRKIQIENDPNAHFLRIITSIEETNIDESTRKKQTESMHELILLGELLLQMRKEIGFGDSSISTRKLLSLIFEGIYNSEHDQYFINVNVPIY